MTDLTTLLPFLDQGATLVFAILVWRELHAMRTTTLQLLIRIDERLSVEQSKQ